jgi:hypothetical protein
LVRQNANFHSPPFFLSLCSALRNAGYKALPTHCAPNCVKTDAPAVVMMDIMRAWAVLQGKAVGEGSTGHAVVKAYLQNKTAAADGSIVPAEVAAFRAPGWAEALRALPIHEAILSSARQSPMSLLPAGPVSFEGNATTTAKEHRKTGGASAARFVPNPGANWGPKSRATGLGGAAVGAEGETGAGSGAASAAAAGDEGTASPSSAAECPSKKAKLQTWG